MATKQGDLEEARPFMADTAAVLSDKSLFGLPKIVEDVLLDEKKRQVALVVFFYFVISISLVFLNKYVLSKSSRLRLGFWCE